MGLQYSDLACELVVCPNFDEVPRRTLTVQRVPG
jgi:hypothetical protein